MFNLHILKKINYYIITTNAIQHPLNIHKSYIMIQTDNKLKSIDRFNVSIDNIIDMCDFPHMDKLL
jgi:hypothetical protein